MILRIIFLFFYIYSHTEQCVRTIPPEEVYITSTGANLPSTEAPENQCTECDIKDIAPNNLATEETFTPVEKAAAGQCKETQVTCGRSDTQTCQSAGISATTANGQVTITDTRTSTSAVSTLKCEADGTYSYGTTTGITRLSCNFVTCVPPATSQCTKCNINTIAPDNRATGETFTPVEKAAAGQCKETQVTCGRSDTQTCQSVGISATTANGQVTITDTSSTNSAVSTIKCAEDGTYSYGTTTGITKLSCNFVTCVPPATSQCTECNINTIAPDDLATGETFTPVEKAAAGQCKETQVTCGRSDTQTCQSSGISATSANGQVTITDTSTTTSAVSTLTCAADGTYSYGTTTGITKLSCNFDTCETPPNLCDSCDSRQVAPRNIGAGESVSVMLVSPPGECLVTQFTCQRDDTQICQSVGITATTANGQVIVTDTSSTTSATTTLTCANDGTYSYGTTAAAITELSCNFNTCELPRTCNDCDVNTIAPMLTDAATAFTFVDSILPSGCKSTTMTCKRIDNQACVAVRIRGIGNTGAATLVSTNNGNSASADLVCAADGTYQSGVTQMITQLSCAFETCALSCASCNTDIIAPILTDPNTSFEYEDSIDAPSGCKDTLITCKRTDSKICESIMFTVTDPIGTVNFLATPNTNTASIFIYCYDQGTYMISSRGAITRLGCVFTNCV